MISESLSLSRSLARHPDSADPLLSRVDLGEAPMPVRMSCVFVFTVSFTHTSGSIVE